VLGAKVADNYDKAVGSQIEFSNMKFRVIGIFETGSLLTDNIIYIPIDAAREITGKSDDVVSMVYVELNDPKDAEDVAKKINFKFDEIEAKTGAGFAEDIGGLLSSVDAFFVIISSIALFVGALGIINTMLMSVMERYREFGILRAVGWTRDNLMRLIFYESFFIGIIGSVVGCVLGYSATMAMGAMMGLKPAATPGLMATAFILGILLSIIGGLYPAYRASRLDPIEAIRYG
jgi:putative ABC transport system permease protein